MLAEFIASLNLEAVQDGCFSKRFRFFFKYYLFIFFAYIVCLIIGYERGLSGDRRFCDRYFEMKQGKLSETKGESIH